MSVAEPENRAETEATVQHEFSAFETFSRLGLGQECPSYINRSFDDSDFWSDFHEDIADFRTAPTKRQA